MVGIHHFLCSEGGIVSDVFEEVVTEGRGQAFDC